MNSSKWLESSFKLSERELDSLPKHERPLRIKLGGIKEIGMEMQPKEETHKEEPAFLNQNQKQSTPDSEQLLEPDSKETSKRSNVYVNVNIFYAKNLAALGGRVSYSGNRIFDMGTNGTEQPELRLNFENHKKSQEEVSNSLRQFDLPLQQPKPVHPMMDSKARISALFDSSQNSDQINNQMLRKRDPNDIRCACHHLHVNDNVKLARFSFKSQLRKIRVRWAGANGDFPIVFKRKLMRVDDECESVSINEVVDFSNKLIQPDCEGNLFGLNEHF